MADGDITSIRISATANTQDATTKLTKLSNLLTELQQKINSLSFPSKRISALASSLEKLNNLKLGADFTKSMDKVTASLKQMNTAIEDPKKSQALAVQLSSIAMLTEANRKYAQAAGAQQMQELKTQEQQAKTAAAQIRLETTKAKAAEAATAKAKAEQKAVEASVKHSLPQLGGGNAQHNVPQLGGGNPQHNLPQLGGGADAENMAQRMGSGTQAMSKMGAAATFLASKLATVVTGVLKVASAIGNTLVSAMKKGVVWVGKLVANMALAPWKALGSRVSGLVTKLKGFFAAIKRIAVYRAIRAALKALTQGFKEGMTNLYQYSKALNGEFAKSMDSLATSSLYLKNSLGAMAAPIINALAPAIDFLVDKIVGLLNKFNELVAAMTGASTWTAALKYPKEWAESTDDAAGKAKELRKTLLGFDEINRLDDNNKGSRGKAAETLDYSKMFEERTVETKAKNFIKKIKEAFKQGDFTDIGKNIGESLKNGLDNIPWDKIKDRVNKNAKSVATLINGFVEVPGLGTSIGRTIAEAFNTAVGKMNTFFDTVHWDSLGKFLGDGINGIIDNFDVGELARGLAGIVNSGFELINNFINTVDWEELGTFLSNGINGFFDELNTEKIGETISNGVRNAIKLVHTFFTKTDFEEIGNKIGKLIKEIDWGAVLKGLAQLLWDAVKAAAEAVKGIAEESPAFALAIAGLVAYKIATALGAATITQTITGALSKAILGASTATGGAASVSGAAVAGKAALVGAAAYGGYKLGEAIGELEPVKNATDSLMEGVFGEVKTEIDPDKYKDEQYDKDLAQWRRQQAEKQIKKDEELRKEIKKTYGGTPGSFYGYASGGTPRTGSLFLAGEAGAEIISSQSGRTSVSNRDQIAESVAQGNEEGNALLREQNDLLRRLLAKDTTVAAYISTDSIVSGLDRKNRRDGRTSVPVGV